MIDEWVRACSEVDLEVENGVLLSGGLSGEDGETTPFRRRRPFSTGTTAFLHTRSCAEVAIQDMKHPLRMLLLCCGHSLYQHPRGFSLNRTSTDCAFQSKDDEMMVATDSTTSPASDFENLHPIFEPMARQEGLTGDGGGGRKLHFSPSASSMAMHVTG